MKSEWKLHPSLFPLIRGAIASNNYKQIETWQALLEKLGMNERSPNYYQPKHIRATSARATAMAGLQFLYLSSGV